MLVRVHTGNQHLVLDCIQESKIVSKFTHKHLILLHLVEIVLAVLLTQHLH